jgi:hemerythrin superfamily protein
MEQHKEATKLFRQAERAKDDAQELQQIVQQCCAMLTRHAEIEEEYFYPVMRENMKDAETIAEAKIEHGTHKQLIAQLQEGDPRDEEYAATFKVLSEYVKHHVKEEEKEIFPRARRVRADWQPLLDALEDSQAGHEEGGEAMRDKGTQGTRAGTGAEDGRVRLGGGILASDDSGEGAPRGRRPASRRSTRARGGEEAGEDTVEEGGVRGREQEQDEQASQGTRSGSR